MNTSVLRAFGASAVLVVGLVSCGSPAAEPGATESTVQQEVSAAPVATATPTPTPKSYTAEELSGLIGQLKDAKGIKLSVMSLADLSGTLEQTKALLASMTVEPAECQEMAISGTPASLEGAAAAMGSSLDATDGASTTVSMTSGLAAALLEQSMAQAGELSKCEKMSITVAGVKVDATVTRIDGLGSVPGTFAYQTDTLMPNGQHQSMITGQAVSQGVLISVMAAGGASQAEAVSRAGAMLDQAAALVSS